MENNKDYEKYVDTANDIDDSRAQEALKSNYSSGTLIFLPLCRFVLFSVTIYNGYKEVEIMRDRLKFAAMNPKKYAVRKWNKDGKECFQLCFCPLLQFFCFT